MKITFYLFRHGETDCNAQGIFQGCKIDADLNAKGEQQARELGSRMLRLGIQEIHSSRLKRAQRTAFLVAHQLGVPIFFVDGLQECNFGEVEGQKISDIKERYPELFHAALHPRPENWNSKFPGEGSESKNEVFERISKKLLDIAHNCKETTIGISTHGGVIATLLAGLGHYDVDVPNCCVAKIEYNDETNRFSFIEML